MSRPLRIGMLAGEASGDILGSRVLRALRRHYPDLRAEGIGGPLMQAEGFDSLWPMERLSVMGFVEPLKRLPELLRIRRGLYRHFRDNPPDLFLGIDSPDFVLALEGRLRATGIPTAHLVSPSVWAWRQGRIKRIRRSVDHMLCLFPFETDIYHQHGVPATCVGHPLAEEIFPAQDRATQRRALGLPDSGELVALLPGSRRGEVELLGPLFLAAAARLQLGRPQLHWVIPAASAERRAQLETLLTATQGLRCTLLDGQSREAMAAADAVMLASGTATLEACLLQRPMVVAYRMAPLSWALVSWLVRSPFAALPNILAGRALVPELLQKAATPEALAATLEGLLDDAGVRAAQVSGMASIRDSLALGFAERCVEALQTLLPDGRG